MKKTGERRKERKGKKRGGGPDLCKLLGLGEGTGLVSGRARGGDRGQGPDLCGLVGPGEWTGEWVGGDLWGLIGPGEGGPSLGGW